MIMDKEVYFSDPQTVTTGTDSGLVSEHTYDLGLEARNVGIGHKPLYVVIIVTTAFTSSGSDDDLAVNLITDDAADLSSPVVVQRLAVIPRASAAGTKVVGVIAPLPGYALLRYLGLQYLSIGDGALTAGAVKAFLTESPDAFVAYASGFEIA